MIPQEITLTLHASNIQPLQGIAIVGASPALGNWNPEKSIPLTRKRNSHWSVTLWANDIVDSEYKFILIDRRNQKLIDWEAGDNRKFCFDFNQEAASGEINVPEIEFRNPMPGWRGAGTAVPVFSLRSNEDYGCGDFLDIPLLAQWCAKSGQSIIQLLPVNDTTMTGTKSDSYPYSAISTIALHPIFLRVQEIGEINDSLFASELKEEAKKLNALDYVDYEGTIKLKTKYLRTIFAQNGHDTLNSREFKAFYRENRDWLEDYAIFCILRDKFGTADFYLWGSMAQPSKKQLKEFAVAHAEQLKYYYFIQYHLDRQLRNARKVCHDLGVALKGDIPIGISRASVDVWLNRRMFNLDSQAGAPPDDFAVEGQTWGFPTYNWQEMEKDGYSWWKSRMARMAKYFDAYRIDHILGFFRIWEVPAFSRSGLLGMFNPALPLNPDEMKRDFGFKFDAALHSQPAENNNRADVLFIADKNDAGKYHPRISPWNTAAYKNLSPEQKEAFDRLYQDYFYVKHNEFWQVQGMKKLPALMSTSEMLACGEDLGMIPECVPEVMKKLEILSLEIERMPKEAWVEFGDVSKYPRSSVATTSTHDMPGLRLWWEQDPAKSQRYYNQILGLEGYAPFFAEPWLCVKIIRRHLDSPSMYCILPLQDWIALDGELRRQNPADEQINIPADPDHYWKYRMHISLEELIFSEKGQRLINEIKSLIENSGRLH